jgi:hypothetical protein
MFQVQVIEKNQLYIYKLTALISTEVKEHENSNFKDLSY